ncbi:hypothetical protein KW791_03975 [Candidatus Parcubacteria bacterium]|nr:hypothetical protein [Candidatus Parcubacteria bacterium]
MEVKLENLKPLYESLPDLIRSISGRDAMDFVVILLRETRIQARHDEIICAINERFGGSAFKSEVAEMIAILEAQKVEAERLEKQVLEYAERHNV